MSVPRRRLTYRTRRRLLWAGMATAFAGALTLTAVFFWNTADTTELWGGKADVYVAPKKTKLTKAERQEIVSVAQLFVDAAVARDRPERAYDIVGPYIRGDLTREDWKSGDIAVAPFSFDAARWSIEYSNEDSVGLRVILLASQGTAISGAEFGLRVVGKGKGKGRRWLIEGWTPRSGGSTEAATERGSETPSGAFSAAGFEQLSPRASTWWLLAPLVLLASGLVVPVVLWIRERRAVNRVRRAMGP